MNKEKSTLQAENAGSSSADHVLKYTGLFGGVQGLTILISLVRTKLVAVLIGADGMGLVQIYNRTIDWLSNATNFGISFSAVRHVSELFDEGDSAKVTNFVRVVRTWSVLTAVLGVLTGTLASPLISYYTFGNFQFTHIFCALSLIVGMLAICGGEMAILKGLRRLKRVALISALGAASTFLTTIPFYWLWGAHGIVPSLLLSTASLMLIQLYFSTRVMPWRVALFSKNCYTQGFGMIRLGVAYIVAGVLGSGVPVIILNFIKNRGALDDVGLYGAGFTLTNYYASIVFMSLDNDYFPRLSAIQHDVPRTNAAINQQLEVCVMLIAPFLIPFMLLQPVIVPLLYSHEFAAAIPMIVCGTLYVFFKAISRPIAYLPLAKGDSKTYLAVELTYDVVFCAFTLFGYSHWGLMGAGIAQSVAYLFDLLMLSAIYRLRYDFRFSRNALRFSLLQGALLAVGLFLAFQTAAWLRYGAGAVLFGVSLFFSYRVLRRESTVVERIRRKFSKILGR